MFLVETEENMWGGAIYVDDTEKLPNQDKMEHLAKYIKKIFKKNENLAIIRSSYE